MRLPLLPALLLIASPVVAQTGAVPAGDSLLIYRILSAEDRRDPNDSALALGAAHADARIATLARRALARIGDSTYAARAQGPQYAARVTWPLPDWRPRYDSLRLLRTDCTVLGQATQDTSWQVAIRAMDLVPVECAGQEAMLARLGVWFSMYDGKASTRTPGVPVTWIRAVHALPAYARIGIAMGQREGAVLPRLRWAATTGKWQMRAAAARAAGIASDTTTLRTLATDRDDNVKEAAIDALAHLTGHADDPIYRRALNSSGAQAVRAAANALKGSSDPESARALDRALRRWLRRPNDSERDARLALLAAAGRPATDDRRWNTPLPLPPEVVPLALGADVRLRVTMDSTAGGGSFVVKLRGDVAPITCARILAMAQRGYYDGLLWQRVVPDFVVQGGGPGANEYVGYTHFFRDELGTVSHLRGGVGMSTRGHDTGDGQWFFDMGDNQRLDKDYTLFGEVMEGMPVVDAIMEGDRIASIRPNP